MNNPDSNEANNKFEVNYIYEAGLQLSDPMYCIIPTNKLEIDEIVNFAWKYILRGCTIAEIKYFYDQIKDRDKVHQRIKRAFELKLLTNTQ